MLELMGSAVLETGPVGSGQAMKALNNLVSACTLLATIEAVKIGERAGLDPVRMVDILNVSTGMSNSSLKKMHQFVLSRKFDSGFGLDLMVKDLNNAKSIASELDCSASPSDRCIQLWSEAAETLGRGQDHTAVVKAIEARESAPAHA
ncbi:NAD-binding protein [Bradyrhizobium manausense]